MSNTSWLLLILLVFPGIDGLAATSTRVLRAQDTQLRVEIVDVDDPVRNAMLLRWVSESANATRTASGVFPLRRAYVRVQSIDSRDPSPVPWGQTRRDDETGVLLFVRRNADYTALRNDWTAVHELSHLYHPYLGDRGRWMAEGLASYFQNVLRARAGMVTAEAAWNALDAGFRRGERDASGVPLNATGRGRANTMRVYWAGAAFWLEADLALRAQSHGTLEGVLDRHARCCLGDGGYQHPADFVARLDQLSSSKVFTTLYAPYSGSTAFPSLVAAYAQLGISRTQNRVEFTRGEYELRDAIMRTPEGATRLPVTAPVDHHVKAKAAP